MNIQRFTFNMFGVNTYLLWDDSSRQAAIIDPGMITEAERSLIDSFIDRNHLEVKYLLNTHLHLDHSFGINHVKNRYGVGLHAHEADRQLGSGLQAQVEMFGLDNEAAAVEIDCPVNEGETFALGNETIIALHTPGHTPGGISYHLPESGAVMSGDTLFAQSVGRTDLPGGDWAALIDSVKTKLLTLQPDTTIYPGHGPETTVGYESRRNPFVQ